MRRHKAGNQPPRRKKRSSVWWGLGLNPRAREQTPTCSDRSWQLIEGCSSSLPFFPLPPYLSFCAAIRNPSTKHKLICSGGKPNPHLCYSGSNPKICCLKRRTQEGAWLMSFSGSYNRGCSCTGNREITEGSGSVLYLIVSDANRARRVCLQI